VTTGPLSVFLGYYSNDAALRVQTPRGVNTVAGLVTFSPHWSISLVFFTSFEIMSVFIMKFFIMSIFIMSVFIINVFMMSVFIMSVFIMNVLSLS